MIWEVEFSIGPVQGFVAQSRRTRDLWGSSYLLAYLAACGMQAARSAGGEVVRPYVDDNDLLRWVASGRSGPAPSFGSLPNHFVVSTTADPRQVAGKVVAEVRKAWQEICDAVWQQVVLPHADKGNDTATIWNRQVSSCWEIVWVAGDEGQIGGLLERRKHWRAHHLSDEPGDKCTVMPDFQELSGYVSVDRHEARRQSEFWQAIRQKVGELNLRDGEKLCAPAMVKRLFTRYGPTPIRKALDPEQWPSTLYVGAVPWLRQVAEHAAEPAAAYAGELSKAALPGTIRRRVPVPRLAEITQDEFFRLDANFYYRHLLADPQACPLKPEAQPTRTDLGKLLDKVNEAAGEAAPVYYALLVADGDQLGQLIREVADPPSVARAMAAFAGQVKTIVEKHYGVTVYAGGDDVLAMLPVPGALACADELALAFADAFQSQVDKAATLSAAVVFAHMRMPVGGVLHLARRLLEDVAKEANGRDSLAVAVAKPGGENCRWVTTWTRHYPQPDGTVRAERAVKQLGTLVDQMRDPRRDFSASLLHHTRDVLDLLTGLGREPGATGTLPADLDLAAYVRAEITDSWDGADETHTDEELGVLTQLVTDLLSPSPARQDDGQRALVDRGRVTPDGLLLAALLAGEGREDDHR
ncbi:MAG: type III-B CRISPR-associated protein Cas10/Cmr2 [Micromonosporaceae bacterium]|nr:type III-B CRISPR-associated protein Cas10/Cmr2 [Micromonosporaceae bacterium]